MRQEALRWPSERSSVVCCSSPFSSHPGQAADPCSATSHPPASPPISLPVWMGSSRSGIVGIPRAVLPESCTVVRSFIVRASARPTWEPLGAAEGLAQQPSVNDSGSSQPRSPPETVPVPIARSKGANRCGMAGRRLVTRFRDEAVRAGRTATAGGGRSARAGGRAGRPTRPGYRYRNTSRAGVRGSHPGRSPTPDDAIAAESGPAARSSNSWT